MLYPQLSPLPSAYHTNGRRTRAADTDEGGRRAGGPEDDHKDVLPAYDSVGGPPKYVDIGMDAGTRLHLDLPGVAEREQNRDIPDDERDMSTQNTEEVASSSHSNDSRRSSAQSQSNLRQSEIDTPAPDPPVTHHSA